MGAGAILEPLVVIVLLFGGTWINRSAGSFSATRRSRRRSSAWPRDGSPDSVESGMSTPTAKDGLLDRRSASPSLLQPEQNSWHRRQIGLFSYSVEVTSPNTVVFQDRFLSRLLRKLPFLAECWYWALVYWVWILVPPVLVCFCDCLPTLMQHSVPSRGRGRSWGNIEN